MHPLITNVSTVCHDGQGECLINQTRLTPGEVSSHQCDEEEMPRDYRHHPVTERHPQIQRRGSRQLDLVMPSVSLNLPAALAGRARTWVCLSCMFWVSRGSAHLTGAAFHFSEWSGKGSQILLKLRHFLNIVGAFQSCFQTVIVQSCCTGTGGMGFAGTRTLSTAVDVIKCGEKMRETGVRNEADVIYLLAASKTKSLGPNSILGIV
ncbi:hypothetical protein DPX16_4798 [Anabarilius grahami]|uniref:Uncharacterized protein n=1 Tax=Anabarilius grahami TaxID=495550 RepID=A0A3N0Z2S0_ANAGA|nr:hypothetical protein DPX16_4798 [Anabarilius grahami]